MVGSLRTSFFGFTVERGNFISAESNYLPVALFGAIVADYMWTMGRCAHAKYVVRRHGWRQSYSCSELPFVYRTTSGSHFDAGGGRDGKRQKAQVTETDYSRQDGGDKV